MNKSEVMMIPKLTQDEYSKVVENWNSRVRRGPAVEPCTTHNWARLPNDTEAEPKLICINCLRTNTPLVREDPRQGRPMSGHGAAPPRGNGRPI